MAVARGGYGVGLEAPAPRWEEDEFMTNPTDAVVRIEDQREGLRQAPFVAQPQTIEDTGLDFGLPVDLCIKSIYYLGRPPARIISSQLAFSYHVVVELLTFLKREQMCEVVGSNGIG